MIKRRWFVTLMFFCLPAWGSTGFNELGKNPKALESGFDFSSSSLKIIQKRWLPKKFLSEVSLGLSPVLKGFNYMNNYAVSGTYRFFFSDNWSAHFQYSWHFNPITQDGIHEVTKRGKIPVELKYYQKQSYTGGIDWYPLYGKVVLYNQLVYLDLYVSLSGGITQLINLNKSTPLGSLGLGLVCWWHKNFNTRLEVQGAYYSYGIPANNETETIKEFLSKIYISAGVLF